MNKKLLLTLLVGFSALVVTSDEDFNENPEKMPFCQDESYSGYTETILLSDIIVEYGPILETYPAQQYITLKYEDAVRHDKIDFKNDAEQKEQITLAKEFFKRDLLNLFDAIKVILPRSPFDEYGMVRTMECKKPYIDYITLRYVESEGIMRHIYIKTVYEVKVAVWIDGNDFSYDERAVFNAKKEFRNWIISQERNYA